ncbi:MAG: DUF6544 family protein [Gemmatimonadaceae bacterium]
MASAELLRYLAEAVWLPTALLPSARVSWTPVSDTVAIATLTDDQTSTTLDVYFGERGEIVRIATMRYRDVDGTPVLTPWVGHFGNYQRVKGMMIPMSGDVEWVLPGGLFPYWRTHVVSADYEFAPTVAATVAPASRSAEIEVEETSTMAKVAMRRTPRRALDGQHWNGL